MTLARSPWRHVATISRWTGSTPLFGSSFEDECLEVSHLQGRIVAIAGAGDTPLALAASDGNQVTAVDIDPAQIALIAGRAGGAGPPRIGRVDAGLRLGRALAGWSQDRLAEFAALEDPETQSAAWRTELDTWRFRLVLAASLRPIGAILAHHPADRPTIPARFDRVVRRRLARGFATHPNRTNPIARRYLLEDLSELSGSPYRAIDLRTADVADYLERVAPASVDGFAMSNVLDGTSRAYATRLLRAVRHAAAPDATVAIRSLAEPTTGEEQALARRDRSHLWGRAFIGPVEGFAEWVARS